MSLCNLDTISQITDLDEVLGWEGLKHGHKEVDGMLICAVLALEEEVLMMENDLTVHIFYQNPECLATHRTRSNETPATSCLLTKHTYTGRSNSPQRIRGPCHPTGSLE